MNRRRPAPKSWRRAIRRPLPGQRFRRRLFRAFQAWYADNRTRLWMPLHLCGRTDRVLRLAVGEIPANVLEVVIVDHGHGYQSLSVCFLRDGEVVDLGFSGDVVPLYARGGVRCAECVHEDSAAPAFPSRQALWADHLFEGLLHWLNDRLADTAWLDFGTFGTAETYARPVSSSPRPAGKTHEVAKDVLPHVEFHRLPQDGRGR